MKKPAVVMLADEAYIEPAKQLIYGCRKFGNWRGDYILIAHEVPAEKLKWFRDRGIEIMETLPLISPEVIQKSQGKAFSWPQFIYSKLLVLHPRLANREKVIFLDCDILIRKDINALLKYKGFAARRESMNHNLLYQFIPDFKYHGQNHKREIEALKKQYDFSTTSFNAGVMVVPTRNNTKEQFNRAVALANKIHGTAYFPEQAVFNLLFYKNWENIPYVYNDLYVHDWHNKHGLQRRKDDSDAVILHCVGNPKPFEKESDYYAEWKKNYDRVDELFDVGQIGDQPDEESIRRIEKIDAVNTPLGRMGRLWWRIKSKLSF